MCKKYWISLLLPVLLVACQKEIDVKLPSYNPKLYLYSVSEVYEPLRITLGKSVPVQQYRQGMNLAVQDATMHLFVNDRQAQQIYFDETSGTYNSGDEVLLSHTYKVQVSAPGFEPIEASCKVPDFVLIEQISYRDLSEGSDGIGELMIQFTDPPTANDYYIVELTSAYELAGSGQGDTFRFMYDYGCIKSSDPAIDAVANRDPLLSDDCLPNKDLLITDALFNGSMRQVVLKIPRFYADMFVDSSGGSPVTTYPQVKLKHVGEDYVRYIRSYKKAAENSGNPFAEPVNVFTNVKNGYGLFSLMAVDVRPLIR